MEGISYETFRTWQSEKSVFSVAIKKAEAACKVARIQTILKASDKSWQAAAWWLERRYGDEYGRIPKEEPENVVTMEELEEAGRLQDAERYGTIEEARAAWAKEEEDEKRCKACVVCNPPV